MTGKSLEDFEWHTVDNNGKPILSKKKLLNDIFSTIMVMISSFVATILFLWFVGGIT